MIKHTVQIASVLDVNLVKDGDQYTSEIEIMTDGGVCQILRFPHAAADAMRGSLTRGFDALDPDERNQSFRASLGRA